MSSKKARGRTNRRERGAAARTQPSPAVPSASHEPPRPHPYNQQPACSQEATTTLTNNSEQVTRNQLADKLRRFIASTVEGLEHANTLLVARRFASDVAALSTAAERGDAQAQLAMMLSDRDRSDDPNIWLFRLLVEGSANDDDDVLLCLAVAAVNSYLDFEDDDDGPERAATKDQVMAMLRVQQITARPRLSMWWVCSCTTLSATQVPRLTS